MATYTLLATSSIDMIFVDDSIQHEFGYVCLGFAYCQDSPDTAIAAALEATGLTPGKDEYKSGARMQGQGARHTLRELIGDIVLSQCRMGVYVASVCERSSLMPAVIDTAESMVVHNRLPRPQIVMVDGGINGKIAHSNCSLVEIVSNCDSKSVLGIQLADYVAYHCSYLLKCVLAGTSKTVTVDLPCHPQKDEQVDFDWLTRTELRRSFFVENRDVQEIRDDDWFFRLAGYGAFYSPKLSPKILSAARRTFDSMYLGCVW